MFPVGLSAAMHARTQQRLHPLLCGVNLAPANVIIPARRHQSDQLYGRSRDSEESYWNFSGGMVGTSYLPGSNFLRVSFPGGYLIDASSWTANGSSGGSGDVIGLTEDVQYLDGDAGEFEFAFERTLSDTIDQSIPVNYISSTEESAPTFSADVTASVISGNHDSIGTDQRQSSA